MVKTKSKSYMFETMPIPQAVATLSIPMVVSSLVTVVYNLADTYFVGMLNDPIQNAAVTLVYPVMLAFNTVNNLFGVGTSSMMSRKLGSKEYEKVRTSSSFGFWGALFCSSLLALLCTVFKTPLLHLLGADSNTIKATSDYMFWTVNCGAVPAILNVVIGCMVRSEGAALHASIGTMSGCILNIILDPIFILPQFLNMGAAGAGLATFISNLAACMYFFVLNYIKKKETYITFKFSKLKHLTRDVVLGILGVGIPASIQNFLNVTGTTILNNFTSSYGASAIASMGISHKLFMIPSQIALGFSQGVMPLVSYNYASGNRKRMKRAITFAFQIMVPSMLLITAIYYIDSEQLISLFIDNKEIISYGGIFLRRMCIGMIFLTTDFMVVGVFQALGLGKNALIFAILRKIVFEIPLLFLLNYLDPLYGLASAQSIAEIILTIIAIIMLIKIFKQTNDVSRETYDQ